MEQARRPSRSRERETEEDLLFFFFLPLAPRLNFEGTFGASLAASCCLVRALLFALMKAY